MEAEHCGGVKANVGAGRSLSLHRRGHGVPWITFHGLKLRRLFLKNSPQGQAWAEGFVHGAFKREAWAEGSDQMANRNTQTHGFVSRKLPCCWIFLVILLVLYCIFFWDSTALRVPIDNNLLPNQKAFSLFENQSIPLRDELRDDLALNQEVYSLDQPKEQELEKCDPSNSLLRVFIYDMPPEFHFGLLDWVADGKSVWLDIRTKIPSYPGGLNLQHSIECWLTLDLLSSRFPDRSGPCTAVRVEDSREADVVFVPFFSSLSYNRYSKIKPPEKVSRNKMLQQKLVLYLTAQEEWKRSGGTDHIVMAHHPNSMLDARTKLWPCMFILADFGRYIPRVANVEKDIVAPSKHARERKKKNCAACVGVFVPSRAARMCRAMPHGGVRVVACRTFGLVQRTVEQ